MEHDFRENTHSNVLEYIFDYKLIGTEGADILSDFILNIQQYRKFIFSNKKKNLHN